MIGGLSLKSFARLINIFARRLAVERGYALCANIRLGLAFQQLTKNFANHKVMLTFGFAIDIREYIDCSLARLVFVE